MDIIHVDIMKGEKLSSIWVATLVLIYCLVLSSSMRRKDGVKGDNISQLKELFIILGKNIVQHPSIKKKISG